jgi:starch-binding outer membrane protein, SusD/RagB family
MKNIFFKFRLLRFLFVIVCTVTMPFLIQNCSKKNLDLTNPNALPVSLFWKTADDAEKGLVACYGPLTSIQGWGRMLGAILTIQRGDDVNPFPSVGVQDAGTFLAQPTDGRVTEGWGELNAIVARANSVIANVSGISMTDAEKIRILGEAYFLRGEAHFYLLNIWGHIPLILKPIEGVNDLFIEQAPQDQVWNSIIADFKDAQSRLPEAVAPKEIGRATWGAATAMLGKSYLFTKKWPEAAAEFKKIIDKSPASSGLYQLVANYQDNFLESGDNNSESIWELQYQNTPTGNWGASGTPNPLRGQAWEADIAPVGYTSQGTLTINQWVFDLFMQQKTKNNQTDPRAFASMVWNYPGAKLYSDANGVLQSFQTQLSGANLNKIWDRKYLNYERTSSLTPGSWGYATNNRRMVRFADVLLMYAEAQNEVVGSDANAYSAINRVRARADMPDITAGLGQDAFRTAVRNERVLELSFEGDRVFDLLRWGTLATVFTTHPEYRSNSGGIFKPGFEYLPIPQNDINANPKIKQNPGY